MSLSVGTIPKLSFALAAAFIITMAVRSHDDTTLALVVSSLLMFDFCWANASHLLFTRVVGYHLMSRVLLDQTRPLKLPQHLLNQVTHVMGRWGEGAKAPRWLNPVEDRLTQPGAWTTQSRES